MTARRYRVFFDQTQNERGRLDSTYSHLGQLLRENGFDVESYTEYMILPRKLKDADIMVFGCPNSSKLRPPEIDTLKRYVKEGGGLMLLSLSGGDRGLMNNLSQLSKDFGIVFENTAVKDERNNAGMPTMPIIRNIVQHPTTDGVSELIIPAACTLRVSDKAVAIAHTSAVADPASQPIIAVAEYGKGRVICVGSYEIFRSGGLKNDGNRTFALNAFRWLVGTETLVRPSEVTRPTISRGTEQTTGVQDLRMLTDIENTLKKLVDTVLDLSKELKTIAERVDGVDSNIESLREQFQTFAEKTQQQLGMMIPTKQFRTKEESKAEQIKSDILAIEKEIESVKQLREHIEQRYASGTMPQETYEEQTKKLDDRIKSLGKRLKKKKKELEALMTE